MSDTQRGAIILPDIQIDDAGTGFSFSGGGFDPQVLRNALLLFDHVVHPDNNCISIGDIREQCGNIENVHTSFSRFEGTIGGEVFRTAAGETFSRLEERESGRWSLVRGANQSMFPEELFKGQTALKLRLTNALPLPDREVPLEDVLVFKQRRTPELAALRTYIDGLVLEAQQNGFEGLAQTHALDKLLGSLEDYNRSLREQNFLKRMTDVEIKFNWSQLAPLFVASGLWTQGFTVAALATVGAAASSSISLESSLGPKSRGGSPSPFEYIFRAKEEL